MAWHSYTTHAVVVTLFYIYIIYIWSQPHHPSTAPPTSCTNATMPAFTIYHVNYLLEMVCQYWTHTHTHWQWMYNQTVLYKAYIWVVWRPHTNIGRWIVCLIVSLTYNAICLLYLHTYMCYIYREIDNFKHIQYTHSMNNTLDIFWRLGEFDCV